MAFTSVIFKNPDEEAVIDWLLLKNVLKKFFYKKWKRRSWIVKDITNVLFEGEDIHSEVDEDDDDDNTTKLDTYTQTFMLYKQGYSVDEIAQMRGFKKSTMILQKRREMMRYEHVSSNFFDANFWDTYNIADLLFG